MRTLICGSMAFDTVMVFPGRFRDHILPDRIHLLNVSFLVPSMRRNFGGCAGNIAYNLRLLGGSGLPMAHRRARFRPYASGCSDRGVDVSHGRVLSTTSSRRRPSSRPISTTTRSRPFTRAR